MLCLFIKVEVNRRLTEMKMNNKPHKKHVDLNRPQLGQWGRNEYAILGTTCGEIQSFAKQISTQLSSRFTIAYIDASHSAESEIQDFSIQSTQHQGHWEFQETSDSNLYLNRLKYYHTDIQLINGNHFLADRQIIFLDPVKKDSLQRKLDRLSQVDMIVKQSEDQGIYPFLQPYIAEDTLVLNHLDIQAIADKLSKQVEQKKTIKGLILAGGKSTRMGTDKGQIDYHGEKQVDFLAKQLSEECDSVFVSLSSDQHNLYNIPAVVDSFGELGPLGGILSAFKEDCNAAWLTIAADLPMVNSQSIQYLLDKRDSRKIATCFIRSDSQFPDPLFTIWEPKAYLMLLKFIALGYSCPRKVLINADVNVIQIPDDKVLMNVNNPEQMAQAKSLLANK